MLLRMRFLVSFIRFFWCWVSLIYNVEHLLLGLLAIHKKSRYYLLRHGLQLILRLRLSSYLVVIIRLSFCSPIS